MSATEPAMVAGVETRLLIGGQWKDAASGAVFQVTSPADGSVIASVADAAAEDVDAAIDSASAAFTTWKRTPAVKRAATLIEAARLLRERIDDIARLMTYEQGKPQAEAAAELESAAGFLSWFAGEAERTYGEVVPPQAPNQRIITLRQPVGVTAAITPWNFPGSMLARKISPALAAGCTMIVKPAAATPLTAAAIVGVMLDAGLPAGVLNLVPSSRSPVIGARLFGDSRVSKVSFTGSTEVGQRLIQMSATHITRLSLELGGHSPYLIFADADLERSADQLIASKFRNSGQTCVCANRAYVERPIYEQFLKLIRQRAERLVLGSGLDPRTTMGPLIDAAAVTTVEKQVTDALERGASLVTGGKRATVVGFEGGNFFEPTIVADTTSDMRITFEETFGPALAVQAFDTDQEAIELANQTRYGLAAYVHTRDYGRLLRVAEDLDFGIVGVETGVITAPNAPFAGRKASGYGVEGGSSGIHEYLSTKYVLFGDV